ncbi:hypothetical protein BH10CYA1_BH10CYA1_62600 [soil metagenome]
MSRKYLLVLFAAVACIPAANADDVDNWLTSYVAPKSLALKKIELRKNDKGEVKIRAYGTGYPDDVDWGEVTAQVHKQVGGGLPNFLATFSIPKAKELLIINPNSGGGKPNSGGYVLVELFTTFNDGRQSEFVRLSMQTPQK